MVDVEDNWGLVAESRHKVYKLENVSYHLFF